MAVCYDKLWNILEQKNMKKTELKDISGISFNVLARLGKKRLFLWKALKKSVQFLTVI